MTAPRPAPAAGPPDWVGDALSATGSELSGYATVLCHLAVHPRRFVYGWATGARPYMNPLGVMATGVTLYSIIGILAGFTTSVRSDQPFWLIALNALAPYLHLVLIGALCHGMLRVGGSTRRLRDSLAVVLYVGGGIGVVYRLLTWATAALLSRSFGMPNILHGQMPRTGVIIGALVYGGGLLIHSSVLVRALATLHRRSAWTLFAMLLVAMYVAAILYGLAPIANAVDLGPHLWLRLDRPHLINRLIPNLSV